MLNQPKVFYPANHFVPYLASTTFPASLCFSLPLYILSQASSPSLSCPILLCQLHCPQLAHPPILWSPILLHSVFSSLPASILVLYLKLHLLSYSLLTAFYHMWLQPPPSPLSFPNLRLSCLTLVLFHVFLSSSLSICSLRPVPVSALVSAPITFSEDLKPTHLCVHAEAVRLSLFYSIIHFSF